MVKAPQQHAPRTASMHPGLGGRPVRQRETLPAGARMRSKYTRLQRHEWPYAVMFLAPAVILFVTFELIPIVQGVKLAFSSWDGFNAPVFVGLKNFGTILHDPVFYTALKNNLVFLAATPLWVVFPLIIALLLQSRPRGWRVFRFLFMLPTVLSAVFTGIYFKTLLSYDGPVNQVLRDIGLGNFARGWLVEPRAVLIILIGIIMWSTFGVGTLVFMAALSNVDVELQEAALIDGASKIQVHRYVTIPSVRPTMQFWSVNVVIVTFTSLFPLIYVITGGGPGYSTYVLEFSVYESAFSAGKFGVASATGVIMFVLVFIIAIAVFFGFKHRED